MYEVSQSVQLFTYLTIATEPIHVQIFAKLSEFSWKPLLIQQEV